MAAAVVGDKAQFDQIWKELEVLAQDFKDGADGSPAQLHLRDLMQDDERCGLLVGQFEDIVLDFSRQRISARVLAKLFDLAKAGHIVEKMKAMISGEPINNTENRPVLHAALRAPEDAPFALEGKSIMPQIHAVLQKVKRFSEGVRSGHWLGATGIPVETVVVIGIGGSYLGPQFVSEALRFAPGLQQRKQLALRFLANVDPVSIKAALEGLNPETTLAVVVSKTFTTAETMLNARAVRQWLVSSLRPRVQAGDDDQEQLERRIVSRHMVACSTNGPKVAEFGIDPENMFEFWDWVGGRYSVWSAVGAVPVSLQLGFDCFQEFLAGAYSLDRRFFSFGQEQVEAVPQQDHLAVVLGLLGVWNCSFLGYSARTLACYSHALALFAPHIQQVDMESNGKGVAQDGTPLDVERRSGELTFGEPGTNNQHSYFQLLHQGRVVPADFIGFVRSPFPLETPQAAAGELYSNHDELMANFFAQPDALAVGVSAEELRAEGAEEHLVPARVMTGNRPSSVLLLPELSPRVLGQLLAMYEHRTAVQGWIWGLNSFDQFGVELGKKLANKIRSALLSARAADAAPEQFAGFNSSTAALLARFTAQKPDPATRVQF